MLHEQNSRLVFEQQVFYLHAGKNADVVEWFIPDIQVCLLTQAFGKQNFLFLPLCFSLSAHSKLFCISLFFYQDEKFPL